jgi:hypothetical protein
LIPPWLSVRGPARFQYDYILFITWTTTSRRPARFLLASSTTTSSSSRERLLPEGLLASSTTTSSSSRERLLPEGLLASSTTTSSSSRERLLPEGRSWGSTATTLYGYIEQGPSTNSMTNPGDNGAPVDPVNRPAFGYTLNLLCFCLLFKFYLSFNLNTCTCFALTRSLITIMNLLIISGIKMYRKLPIYLTQVCMPS